MTWRRRTSHHWLKVRSNRTAPNPVGHRGHGTKTAVRTNLTGTVDFTDSAATNYSQRYYRAVAP